MNHSTVAHRWANDQYTRNGELNGPRMFAEESTRAIYSHGRHFCIARKTGNLTFPVLFTYRRYSPSTAKHIAEVRNACRHLGRFLCYNPADSYSSILHTEWTALEMDTLPAFRTATDKLAAMQGRIAARAAKGLPESDTLASQLETLQGDVASRQVAIRDRVTQLDEFARAFGVNLKRDLPSTYLIAKRFLKSEDLMQVSAEFEKQAAKRAKDLAKARAKAEAEAIIRRAENRLAWLAGESVSFRTYGDEPTLLRVIGDEVQTSAGASVPVRHALRLYKLASDCVTAEKEWRSPPEKTCHIGHYSLDYISKEGTVRIGCHTLVFSEMSRVAPAARLAAETAPRID